jgi:lysophospholipase L1-like esterase
VIANLWSDQSVVGFQDRDLVRSYQQYRTHWRWKAEFLLRKSRLIQKIREGLAGDPKQSARDIAWQNNWATSSEGEPRVPLNEYAENLSALVVLSESIGAKVAFVALAKKSELNGEIDSRAQAYREIMIQTAEIAHAPIIDAETHWRASGVSVDELFLDFLHPSPKGHQIIGEALHEAISASDLNEH